MRNSAHLRAAGRRARPREKSFALGPSRGLAIRQAWPSRRRIVPPRPLRDPKMRPPAFSLVFARSLPIFPPLYSLTRLGRLPTRTSQPALLATTCYSHIVAPNTATKSAIAPDTATHPISPVVPHGTTPKFLTILVIFVVRNHHCSANASSIVISFRVCSFIRAIVGCSQSPASCKHPLFESSFPHQLDYKLPTPTPLHLYISPQFHSPKSLSYLLSP